MEVLKSDWKIILASKFWHITCQSQCMYVLYIYTVPIRINLTGNAWQNAFCFRSARVPVPVLYPFCIRSVSVLFPFRSRSVSVPSVSVLETRTGVRYKCIISNGNRTKWSPIRSVIIRVIRKSGATAQRESDLFITSMITVQIGRHKVLLPINYRNYNFREKKNTKVWKWKVYIKSFYTLPWWLKPRSGLVALSYNLECDWLINKLSDNKLSDNNLTSE